MQNAQLVDAVSEQIAHRTTPWNKGKLTGAKPPLLPKHVWAIRTRLQMAGRTRDLALFNIAIDSKLRGCDIVGLRVEDIAPRGYALDRATIRQRKTGRPVRFEISEQARQAVDDHLAKLQAASSGFLFPGRRRDHHLTTRQYARLLSEWLSLIGLDPSAFGTHSVRRIIGDGGLFLAYENASPDGEDRTAWLRRWADEEYRCTAYSADEWRTMADHVVAHDFPETSTNWRDLGRDAGFRDVREVFIAPTNLYRMYFFRP